MAYQKIPEEVLAEAFDIYVKKNHHEAHAFLRKSGHKLSADNMIARFRRRGWAIGFPRNGGGNCHVWTEEEVSLLSELYPNPLVPQRIIVDSVGNGRRQWRAIDNKAKKLGLKRGTSPSPQDTYILPSINITRPILVIADLHVPFQHKLWLDRMIGLAKAWGAEDAVLAGDAIDGQELSKFEVYARPNTTDEVAAWRDMEATLLNYFRNLHWFMGNHEGRVGKLAKWKMPLYRIIDGLFVQDHERVKTYNSYAMRVNDTLHLEHPGMVGKTTAADLCSVHLMDVAVAHLHHSQDQLDRSGRFQGIHIGAAADHNRMLYCSTKTFGKWKMTNGGLIVVPDKDGLVYWNLRPTMPLERMTGIYSPEDWE